MFWYSLYQLIAFLLDSLRVVWQPLDQKDLEILFLRQQLAVVRRRQKASPTSARFEKLLFATLITQIQRQATSARAVRLTSCSCSNQTRGCTGIAIWFASNGRMPARKTAVVVREPMPRLRHWFYTCARENGWGGGVPGELKKLAVTIGETTVRDILRRHGMPPAPERQRRTTAWRTFLATLPSSTRGV